MASREVDYAGGKRAKPPRTRCQKICRAIYNPDKGEFFGRTCSNWAKIGVFYLVFYSCLAGFFSIMLFGFFATLNEDSPTMQGLYSLIKANPGMGFRPLEAVDSTLIKFNTSNEASYAPKILDMLNYMTENGYIDKDEKGNYKRSTITEDSNGNATFDFESNAGECNIDWNNINKSFGYHEGKPCVMLKINRVYGWEPKAYKDNDSIPEDAKKVLGGRVILSNSIQVTCEGENDGDVDNLGEIKYFPDTGFSFSYFPYVNAKNYRAPLVFVKFNPARKGVVLQIWCKMWAENILIHKNDKAGSSRFEIMIDHDVQPTPASP